MSVRIFRLILPVAFLLSSCPFTGAQNRKIDSLKIALNDAEDIHLRSDYCHELASELWDYDFEKGKQYADQAYELALKSGYALGLVQSLTDEGMYFYFQGDYDRALDYYRQAMVASGENNFGDFPAYTLCRMGNLYRMQSNFDSARVYYELALKLVPGTRYPLATSSAYYNLGLLDLSEYRYADAERNILKSLSLREQMKDSLLMAESWRSLGLVYKGQSEFEKAKENYGKALAVALHYNDPEMQMFCYVYSGELATLQGDYTKSLIELGKALDILKTHKFRRVHALALQRIGELNWYIGNFASAQEYFLEALRIYATLDDKQEQARTLGSVAWVILQQNDSLAMDYARQALALAEKAKSKEVVAYADNLMGFLYFKRKDYSRSLDFYSEALALRREIKSKPGEASTQENIALVHEASGQYELARQSYLSLAEFHLAEGNRPQLANANNNLGALSIKMHDYAGALRYLNKASEIINSLGLMTQKSENLHFRARLAKAMGNTAEAATLYERYVSFSDSVGVLKSNEKVLQLNALFNIESKEAEIKTLSEQNILKQSQIESQQSKLRAQYIALFLAVLTISLLIAGALVLYHYYKVKNKLNEELFDLNSHIREQNEKIQQQSIELTGSNAALSRLNEELQARQEEIVSQNEELLQSHEEISAHRDLVEQQNKELQEARVLIERQNNEMKARNTSLEEEVENRTQELLEYNQQLEQFAFVSSHNLRAPVARIMGLGTLLELPDNSPADHEFITRSLIGSARELDRIVRDLNLILDVKKNTTSVVTDIDLKEELERILINLEKEIADTQAEIVADFSQVGTLQTVRPYLDSILINLISNSLKYRHPDRKPVISLRTEMKEDAICLIVKDNGLGIDLAAHGDKIFKLYSRFHTHMEGKGLGLYLVKTQVIAMGGSIKVESDVGRGITFQIYFNKAS